MTLRPIPGAPSGASIPDFPGMSRPEIEPPPAPLPQGVNPNAPTFLRPKIEATAAKPKPPRLTSWQVDVQSGSSTLSIRKLNEVSIWVRVDGERDGAYATTYHTSFICELQGKAAIEAMTALKGARSYTFRQYARRVEFEATEDGPVFTLYGPSQRRAMNRFPVSWTLYHEIARMADEMIGPA